MVSGGIMTTNTVSERQRTGCLSTWLIILIGINVFAAISYITGGNSVFYRRPEAPDWLLIAFGVVFVLNIICAYGLWAWKKWGLYGFGLSFVATMALHAVIGGNTIAVLIAILGIFMIFALIRGNTAAFE
jgi:hypothetical protein